VTPDGGAVTAPPNATGQQVTFWVSSTSSFDETYFLSCFILAPLTSCWDEGQLFVPAGQTVSTIVTFSTGPGGTGRVGLLAGSDDGRYTVTVLNDGVAATVTPDAATGAVEPTRRANTGALSTAFSVRNRGSAADSYTLTCAGSANVTCGTVSPSGITNLAPGITTSVTVNYSVGGAGTGSLTLNAAGGISSDAGSYTVPVAAAGGPLVDFTPYNFANQDYSLCAVSCFATAYAQSTVPYFSFDTPRTVTLAYNSDRVNPRPFVHVNVTPDTGFTPTEYRLQVKVNGVTRSFVNGDSILRFAYPGRMTVRIGGQFDASSYATNVYPMDILVSAYYAGSQSLITTALSTKLVVVNETNSPVAGGWTLGGVQRLYLQTDSSALVTEGDGSAVYFAKVGLMYDSPSGDFSKLIVSSLSGTNGWARVYPDSAKAVFDITGRMVQLRDRFNNMTTIGYDGSGRVVRVKDPANLRDTLTYGPNGLASIIDPGTPARTTTVTVDAGRKLTAITDPDNVRTGFDFDASLQLTKVINRRADTTRLGYDPLSRKLTAITSLRCSPFLVQFRS